MLAARAARSLPILVLMALFTACRSKPTQVAPEDYGDAPDATVANIMRLYDVNQDGSLDARELDKCPALKTLLASMGKGANGQISKDELTERIKVIQGAKIKFQGVPCVVTLDGNPF